MRRVSSVPTDEPEPEPDLPQTTVAANPDGPAPGPTDEPVPVPVLVPASIPVPAPPRRRRGLRIPLGRRGWTITAAGIVAAAMIAGLIVWSPWKPNPPSAVHVTSPTATTADITWAASTGISAPDHYLVLRDGQQVGSVPAGATSWTDHGLVPGTTYQYTVVAAGLVQSGPSAAVTVTTLTPSPVGLAVTHVTYTTATMHWSPPSDAPPPDLYQIYNGSDLVDTIEGTVTSYTDTHQEPGNYFQYQVIAQWGDHKSTPSAPAEGDMLSVPLSGSVPVSVKTTSVPGGGWTGPRVGDHWTDIWIFSASCPGDSCTISATVDISGVSGLAITLRGSGSTYSGTGPAPGAATCQSIKEKNDTFTLTVTAKGTVAGGAWQTFTGTIMVNAPLTAGAAGYCPAASWRYAVTGS
jgi:Fibronectin type III domain